MPGNPVPARVLRFNTADHAFEEHASVTLRSVMNVLFQHQDLRKMRDSFGAETEGLLTFADWPKGAGESPIKKGDVLEVEGTQYPVIGVKPFPSHHIQIYVQAP